MMARAWLGQRTAQGYKRDSGCAMERLGASREGKELTE